jgi:hypothetical protein
MCYPKEQSRDRLIRIRITLFAINVEGTIKVVGITFEHTSTQNISIQISGSKMMMMMIIL